MLTRRLESNRESARRARSRVTDQILEADERNAALAAQAEGQSVCLQESIRDVATLQQVASVLRAEMEAARNEVSTHL